MSDLEGGIDWIPLNSRDKKYCAAAMKKIVNGTGGKRTSKIKTEEISDEDEKIKNKPALRNKSLPVSSRNKSPTKNTSITSPKKGVSPAKNRALPTPKRNKSPTGSRSGSVSSKDGSDSSVQSTPVVKREKSLSISSMSRSSRSISASASSNDGSPRNISNPALKREKFVSKRKSTSISSRDRSPKRRSASVSSTDGSPNNGCNSVIIRERSGTRSRSISVSSRDTSPPRNKSNPVSTRDQSPRKRLLSGSQKSRSPRKKSVSVSSNDSGSQDIREISDKDRRSNANKSDNHNNSNVDKSVQQKRLSLSLKKPITPTSQAKILERSDRSSRFLNDCDDEINVSTNEKMLQNYIKNNPSLERSNEKVPSNIITDNDDIWLLQCPMSIDLASLKDVNILQAEKKKLKLGNTYYECVKVDDNQDLKVTLLVPPTETKDVCKISSVKVCGSYVLREKVKRAKPSHVIEEVDTPVPFPKHLKQRHPLLGHAFHNLLELPSLVKEKLQTVSSTKTHKSKKRKEQIVEEPEPSKSKKRKRQSEEIVATPKKKIKKEKNLWTSQVGIEKSLFEMSG